MRAGFALSGQFLVRLSELVRAPRGLPGPGFRLPWPAGGQVGWPSRWDHFSGPGGRTAARVPFPRVRFRPLCRGVAKSGPHDLGGYFGRNFARAPGPVGPKRRKKKRLSHPSTCRFRAHLIRQIGRPDPSIRWSSGPPPAAGSPPSTQRTSRDFSPPSRARRRACSDQPRISSSRGVPGGTRDVALSSETRRTST